MEENYAKHLKFHICIYIYIFMESPQNLSLLLRTHGSSYQSRFLVVTLLACAQNAG